MRVAVLALSVSSAAALAAPKARISSVPAANKKVAPSREENPFLEDIGSVGLMGFWDPADLVKDGDPVKFARLRAAELKHGRISQLAVLGHIVTTAGVRLDPFFTPGYDLSKFPTGLAALSALPVEVVFGTILTVALIEVIANTRSSDP